MRTILLTGIGRPGQVGEALAQAFATIGDRVLLVGRSDADVSGQAVALNATGHSAFAYACDLADPVAVDELARRIEADHGPSLDAAVFMAGGFALSGPIDASDPKELDRQLTINLKTAYFATRSFLPMVRRRRGAIVYFASESVIPGGKLAGISAYGIAKSGVVALMRAVAQEESQTGLRANAVAPGSIRTATNVDAMGAGTRYVEREAVADVVTFLCSDAGANISGETVHLATLAQGRVASP